MRILKQMICLTAISVLLAAGRFLLISKDYRDARNFTLIKIKAPVLNASSDSTGTSQYTIPEFFTEPFIIDVDFAKHLYDTRQAVFIDARDPMEFELGKIPGSINLPYDYLDDYSELIEGLDQDMIYVIYCSGDECSLSFDLAEYLFFDYDYPFSSILIYES